ncbi:MAG: amidohydrolase family protein, partial [Dehalococcoidia bacterium]
PNIYKALLAIIGSEKLLFGSDWPLLDPSRVIDEIKSSGLTEDQVESILYRSASRLFGLKG